MVLLGIVPVVIAYFVFRRNDPEHALKRTGGLCLLTLGSVALAIALVASLIVLFQGDTVVHEAEFAPNRSSSTHYGRLGLGPVGLSVWLLLAGAIVALGLFLFIKRFSLRGMLIGLGLVALLASTPHLLIEPRDALATITVQGNRILSEDEWRQLERKLTIEALCENLPEKVTSRLELPPEQAITKLELERQGVGAAEAQGTVGARLAIRISRELDNRQTGLLFNALSEQVKKAVPLEDGR